MPPEENTNKNKVDLETLKVGIDPVFNGNSELQTKAVPETPNGIYNILNNQEYSPSEQPTRKTPAPEITNKKSIVRTYKDDIASAIKDNHLSSINIAMAENQKSRGQTNLKEKETRPNIFSKNKAVIFVSLILILVSIASLYAIYLFRSKNSTPLITQNEFLSIITTDYKDELDTNIINKSKFIDILASRINDIQIPVNNIYNIYSVTGTSTNKRLITPDEFITLAKFRTPDIIKRTFLSNFMVGMFSFDRNLPFVILKSSYFDNAYAGMLEWEKNLEKDFRVLFRLEGYETSNNLVSELTPTEQKKFEDGVVSNKNVRLLRGEDGKIMFLYGIIDQETIIITVSDQSFRELVNRLNKEKNTKR
jgi:hypothetical protein